MIPTIPTRPPDHLDVPEPLSRLVDLAYNAWWTWNREARQLFERINPDLWSRYRNPVRLLLSSRSSQLMRLAEDPGFLALTEDVLAQFDADRARPIMDAKPVAYVSAEFALHESLPIYSGGLGVLSGDHLKEASDMGLPLLGIGLFYRRGYFRQIVDVDGYQQHFYPELDALRLPLLRVQSSTGDTLRVPIELPGRKLQLRVWVTYVGRIPLILLDTFTTRNEPEDRYISTLLYVRGRELRLEQEVVLGRGAVAVLDALGIEPSMFHMNEGHSAFLALENVRRSGEPTLASAIEATRHRHVFTTHTPVPAGNEVFEKDLVRPYVEGTAETFGTDADEVLALGDNGDEVDGFNLTALALRLSERANAVSKLHADVSRKMWPDFEIKAITNGIHSATWMGREIEKVLWAEHGGDAEDLAKRASQLPDETLWAAHTAQKHRLMRFVRLRAVRQGARHGNSTSSLRRIQELLNPAALTLGFARRFAPYKRADLLFADPVRLEELLCDADRPVQLVMAGKAHPADRPGQEIIRRVWQLAGTERLRGRIVFVEDYDMSVARLMVRGVDVWLNTPEWPREASGTSGMKAAINGVIHASVPDGWWAEAEGPDVGFTIGGQEAPDRLRDAGRLFDLLEQSIIPTFYDRGTDGLPRRWIALMRNSMALCLSRFSTRRMLEDYAREMYELPHGAAVEG